MIPYKLLYRLGFAPWERTPGPEILGRVVAGSDGLPPGRALDVGCGTGRDAVYLAKLGWQVTGVDAVDDALAKAKQRAAHEGVEVEWIRGDVSDLTGLGLKPEYALLYDIGCIHGLPDSARTSAVTGLTELAAPGATLLLLAFKRRMVLPRGMDKEEIIRLFGDAWELVEVVDVEPLAESMPPPIRRARPRGYRLSRKNDAPGSSSS
ncbi:MAG: class I SAM-dependent methyltransferase [Actinomycetota bacterium]